MTKNTIFKQILQHIPKKDFIQNSKDFGNDKYTKKFSSWDHFVTLLFCQIKGYDSIRELVTGLKSHANKWYHIGVRTVTRSTFSDANNRRSEVPMKHLFFQILGKCKSVSPKHKFKFKNEFYSLDASTISLCLSMFDWAKFRKKKGAVKIHALLNHKGYVPEWVNFTNGKVHESQIPKKPMYHFPKLPTGSIVAVDRGYIDFEWFHSLTQKGIFFITRAKENMNYRVVTRHKCDKSSGILCDHEIRLKGAIKSKEYPEKLRLIKYRDQETNKVYHFITNNFKLDARTISDGYKERWQIELFFKWIKQNLKIKSFLGTSQSAVMMQIWAALIYYLLLAYLKYLNKIPNSMLEMTRLIREKLFEGDFFLELFDLKPPDKPEIKTQLDMELQF